MLPISPAERAAFDGDVTALPECDPAITQNVCRVPNKVQLSASVGGTVWYDVGGDDQLLDGGDQRLPAWIVELVDPATGEVKAWVGSRDFARDQFDHVAQAARQPGSTFKPFVYGAALESGLPPEQPYVDAVMDIRAADGTV